MSKKYLSLVAALGLVLGGITLARAMPKIAPLAQVGGAPTVVSYQGRVQVDGASFTGTGYFKFAVVNQAGNITYWSNDGTSSGGGEPTNAVPLPVNSGLFTVLLGDTSLTGMTQQLTAATFSAPDRYLRVWFRAGGSGDFTQLAPDTRIAAVPYALQAQHAAPPDNVIVVASSNGDFTSIQAAVDSIPDDGESYLIWIAPGWYEEIVKLKPNIHLQGAGQGLTHIQAAASNGAVVTLDSHTSVRDLSVSNTGTGPQNFGIRGDDVTDVEIANVYAEAGGSGTSNTGIYLTGIDAEVTLENVTAWGGKASGSNTGLSITLGPEVTVHGGTFTGSGGTDAYGIWLAGGSDTFLGAADMRAIGEDASNTNIGLSNSNYPTVLLQGGFFLGSGGQDAYGIQNYNDAHMEAEGVTARGESATSRARAFYNHVAQAVLRGGSFTAQASSGAWDATGIHNFGSNAILEAHDVTALATGGTCNRGLLSELNSPTTRVYGGTFIGRGGQTAYGIDHGCSSGCETIIQGAFAAGENSTLHDYGLCVYGGTVRADASRFKGGTAAVYENSGTLYLAVSQLNGGMARLSGARTCFQVYDGNYNPYTCP